MKFRRILICFVLFIAALPGLASKEVFGQASVNVSTLDPVYRDIDKLISQGLIKIVIMGQRPFSRRVIAKMVAEAMRELPKLEAKLSDPQLSPKQKMKIEERVAAATTILRRLQRSYHEELVQMGTVAGETKWYSAHPLEMVMVDVTAADSLPRTVPPNGLGTMNAIINPLLQYRQGRNLADGGNISLETSHWVRASDHFAFYAQPRFQLGFGVEGQPDVNHVYVQNLYTKFFVKNFEVAIGRDNLFWGQGLNAGLILSNNPRGLDMIKISNDTPSFLPWVFRYLGANKLSFFFANLGPEQTFPYSYLMGWKWSLQPLSFFELGVGLAVEGGGRGSPPASFGERVADLFPIIDFAIVSDKDFQISNKFAGIDFRFRVPPLRGTELYGEMVLDDFDGHSRSFTRLFWDDAGYIFGAYIPRIVNDGSIDCRLEYHHTGLRFYEHGQFFSGWTLNQFILGDDLGPNGNGVYLTVNWDIDAKNLLTFDTAFERRSNDQYTVVEDPVFRFVETQDRPKENRVRGVVSWQHRMDEFPLKILTQIGMERVQNFNFVAGSDRNNYMGRINLEFNFDRWTSFPRTSRN